MNNRPRIIIPEIHQDISNYTKAMYAAGMDPIVVSVQSIQMKNTIQTAKSIQMERTTQQERSIHTEKPIHKENSIKTEKYIQQEFMDYQDVNPASCDGLLLPGGGDINPNAYGEENRGSNPVDEWVDKLQFKMLELFLQCGKPVFGICRGLQLINVWFGGTLIQDLEDAPVHKWKPQGGDQVHSCRTEKGCWLAGLYGETFFHNSSHHQAVGRLGDGLVVDSRCPLDDVVEAFHHTSLPVYAVQWHPERMCLAHERTDTVNGLEILRFFCGICGGGHDSDDPCRDHPFRLGGVVSDGLGL